MFKSNFFSLFSINDRKNIFNDAYDISFVYSLKNTFFRNINNEGAVYSDGKYHINISGKGVLPSFTEHDLQFFSSELFIVYDKEKRDFLVTFNEEDKKDILFEEVWDLFFKKQIIESGTKQFGFPILKVCLISKVVKNSSWCLELIEK